MKDPNISGDTFEMYRKLSAEGALPVRAFTLVSGGRNVESAKRLIAERAATTRPYESTGDDHVIAGGVKLYIDGSGGARTAWLYDEWNRDFTGTNTGNTGYPTTDPDTIRMMIKLFHGAAMHVSVHSIGDRAIDEMARLQKELDAGYPEPSATFHRWIGDHYAGNFGAARSKRLNPFKTFQNKGMIWANGSDNNATPFPARYGIWAAVAREPMLGVYGGDPFGRAESVDVHTALKAVTIWAARQMFMKKKIGSIEVGKYADLAVWDRDPCRARVISSAPPLPVPWSRRFLVVPSAPRSP